MAHTHAQVIVIGGGIAGLSCADRLADLGVEVMLLEAGSRLGGKIQTISRGGVQFEAGPNTLIANRQAMLDQINEAGLAGDVIDGAPAAKKRWISVDDELFPLPRGLGSAIASPLVGASGLCRAAMDLIMGRGEHDEEESVASFVERRFGKRALNNLVSPFLSGVYAGDVSRLEAKAVLPTLVEAEERSGGVIRGMIAARRAARRAGQPKLPMRSITLREGLESLPRAIGVELGDKVRTGAAVDAILRVGDGCRVILRDGEPLACERVVIGTAAGVAADLIGDLPDGAGLSDAMRNRPTAGLAVVGMVFDRGSVEHPLDGFGYVNGPGQKSPVLGALFRSSVFPHTVVPGKVLIVAFVGGALHPRAAGMEESALIAAVRKELAGKVGAVGEPEDVFIRRWAMAIPQYERGHTRLRKTVEAWSGRGPVSIIGSALTGVSLNDCVTAGRAEAERLARGATGTKEAACASA